MTSVQTILLVAAGAMATVALVRLMLVRRQNLLRQLHDQAVVEAVRKRQAAQAAQRTKRRAG